MLSVLNLLLVLVAAWAAGLLTSRLGYPSVLGELVVGIALGPPLLGWLEAGEALKVLGDAGILLMMAYIGMEIDPKELAKASKAGLLAAIGGFVTPFVAVYFAVVWMGGSVMEAVFVGIAAGVTSLATKSRILVDLKLLDTRIAHVMMAGALIADSLSLLVFAVVIGVGGPGPIDAASLGWTTLKAVLFFAAAVGLGVKVLPVLGLMVRRWKIAGKTALFTFALLVTLAYAQAAEVAGMHGILGAFLAGLFLREGTFGRKSSKEVTGAVRDASIGFLAPVFFVTAGFDVSLSVFSTGLGLLLLVIGLATVGKILGTMLFYLPTGFGWREGLTIGFGMNGRGAVEIILAQIGLTMGLISQDMFSILVFMAIATTIADPVLLKWGGDWLSRRGELVRSDENRHGTVLVGAGPMARALGQILSVGQNVTMIDRNKDNCASAQAAGFGVVCGNALDEEEFARTGAARARAVIAMTPNAEVNALVADMARKQFLVPDIFLVSMGNSEGHSELLDHVRASTLFGEPIEMDAWDFFVDRRSVRELAYPIETDLDALIIPNDIRESISTLAIAIERAGVRSAYHGGALVRPGDTLIALSFVRDDRDRLDDMLADCPLLDIERPVSEDGFFGMVAGLLAPRMDMSVDALAERLQNPEHLRNIQVLPGVSVPHLFVEGSGVFELLVARCRPGVRFADQADPVHTAFVVVGSHDERNFHLRALASIARILETPGFDQAWRAAVNTRELRRLLLSSERPLVPPERSETGE